MRLSNTNYLETTCKICDSPTSIWGCVDYNKNCEERNGMYLPYTGVAVYYLKCNNCEFIFSPDFDDWTKDDFKEHIYNDDYIKVDPEYNGIRSKNDANYFLNNLQIKKNISILDYGAGTCALEKELALHGYNVTSWDTMWGTDPEWDKDKKFDLIMAWEVLEHTPSPRETIKEMHNWLSPNGAILLATCSAGILQGRRDPTFWYLSPRNGHICMYSDKSLDILFNELGMKVQHDPWNIHLASY